MKVFLRIGMLIMLLSTVAVEAALPVAKIASGCQADQSYFLTADGRLWGMGTGGSTLQRHWAGPACPR